MDKFYAATAAILLTVVLVLVLRKQNGEVAMLVGLCGCCLVLVLMVGFLAPVVQFLRKLQQVADLDSDMLRTLWKVTGVALIAEIAASICADAGNAALGKSLQMLSSVVILYLSIPMLEALLALVERILVAL